MATTTSTRGTPTHVTTPDVRRLWRVGLAVVAPLPLLAKGVDYVLEPVDGEAPFRETVAAYAADLPMVAVLHGLDVVFGVLLVPATLALVWAARRGAPRLTTAGALLSVPAFLTAFFVLGGTPLAVLTAQHHLDVDAMAAAMAAAEADPVQLVAGLVFLVGVVVGLPVLGVALRRSGAVPTWVALALVVGAGTHPFVPGHVAQGVGLLVAAVGFLGASRALLRTPDDAFDLPPTGRPAADQPHPPVTGAGARP